MMELERFEAKFARSEGCWIWNAAIGNDGYGRFAPKRKPQLAHRMAYEFYIGPVPEGMTLDHLCRNRACVNPAHLEPVSRGENVLRGDGPTAVHKRKTHCSKGHPFDAVNTAIYRGRRYCRTCIREHNVTYVRPSRRGRNAAV